jgi:phosphoribosylanthranilate isomerase
MAQYLRVKICGITTEDDARQAARLGADAIGLNFYPRSPRCIEVGTAQGILHELPPFVEPVGVFVNQPSAEVLHWAIVSLDLRLRTVQLYGDISEVPDGYAAVSFIPAFPVRDQGSLEAITHYVDRCRQHSHLPTAILVDAYEPGHYGGTGQPIPWKLLAHFHPGVPLILAGGLTPENVGEAVRIVRPYAVDVASGVESSPGRKDPDKMRRFIENAREAAAKYL